DEQVHVVRARRAGPRDVAVGGEVADLLMPETVEASGSVEEPGTAGRDVDEEERCGGVPAVAGPLALAPAVDGVVDLAVARQRAVAEDVQHQRHALAGRVLEARAHAPAGAEVLDLAFLPPAAVVVVAA